MKWNERRAMLMGLSAGPVFDKPDEGTPGNDEADKGDQGGEDIGSDRSETKSETNITGGLLDRRKSDEGTKPDDKPENKTPDDGRPEGLADKFWDADKKTVRQDVLAKSYSELETAHGKLKREKAVGGEVPESADDYFTEGLELGDDVDRLTVDGPDDPGLKAWGKVCHKRGIGKELAVDLAKDMFGLMNEHAPEPLDADAEYDKLGKGADAIIDGVFTWVEGAESSGRLSEDDVEVINGLSQTANGIKFLVAMRAMAGEQRIPLVPSTGARGLSQDQWREEMKTAVKDKDYKRQSELEEMSAGIFGDHPSSGSFSGGVDHEKTLTRAATKS